MEVWRRGDVVLDLYEVHDVVRSGGMGLVYRVRHRGWGIDLAVKTPRKALVRSPAAIRAFQAEAEVWVGLGLHPHIANCVYVRTLDGVPRVFAEWADGGSLAEAIRDRSLYGGNALATVLDIAIQTAWGLDHAHGNHVVHQDVKPANVMLNQDGTVKVTDFGMARARIASGESAEDAGQVSPLVSHGGRTVAYCSPEQASASQGLTSATDIWSWAITVFEMFLGRPPCQNGASAADVFAGYVRSGATGVLPMPPAVADVLTHCFTTDPDARPHRLGPLVANLVELHERALGPYPRSVPAAATLLADSLSNHALSMLDLDRADSAAELWTRALRADPRHPHTRYNRGLHRWRTAQITDDELLDELATVHTHQADDWSALLGHIRAERGEPVRETMLTGHEGNVEAVALTPDGRIVVSGDDAGVLRFWDLGTGQGKSWGLGGYRIRAIALPDDGRFAAVAGDIGKALVVDLRTGDQLPLLGHHSWVSLVAVTADGGQVITHDHGGATVTWDLTRGEVAGVRHSEQASVLGARGRLCAHFDYERHGVAIHDARTGELIYRTVTAHPDAVFSEDGTTAVIKGAASTTVQLIDLVTGRPGLEMEVGFGDIGINADATVAFTDGDRTRPPRVWDLRTGRCRLTLPPSPSTKVIVLSADGTIVVTAEGKDLRVRTIPGAGAPAPWSYVRPHEAGEVAATAERAAAMLASATRLAESGRFTEAADEIRAARALPGHRRDADLVRLWRRLGAVGRRTELADIWTAGLITPEKSQSWAVEFNGRGPTAVARGGHDAWVFDIATGNHLHTLSLHAGFISAIALTADGGLAVSGGDDGRVIAWEPRQGRIVRLFTSAEDRVYYVAVSDDGHVALSGTADGQLAAWDIAEGRAIGRWQAHTGAVLGVAVSADHRYGISRGEDGWARIWDLRKASPTHTVRGHGDWIGTACFSDDGRYVLTGGADGTVQIRLTASGKHQKVLSGHTDAMLGMIMSSDGRQVLSCSRDGTLRLWDVDTERCVHVLAGHTDIVQALAVTPDFRLAASGSDDRTIRLWDLTTGACLRTLTGHVDAVTRVALAPDGALLLSSSPSGHLRIWALDWEYDLTEPTGALPAEQALDELRDEVAVAQPSREDHGPGLVEAFGRLGERERDAVTRTLALAKELTHVAMRTETAYRIYVDSEARTRQPRAANEPPGAAEGLALLLRPEHELGRSEKFWSDVFASQLQDDLVLLAEHASGFRRDGDLTAAEQAWRLVVDVRSHLWSAGHAETQAAMLGLAGVLVGLERAQEALVLAQAVADERTRQFGPDDPASLEAATLLASVLAETGDFDAAERIYDDLIPRLGRRYGVDDNRTLDADIALASLLRRNGQLRKAESLLRNAFTKRRLRLGEDHPDTVDARRGLTLVLFDRKRLTEAETHLRALGDSVPECLDHPNRRRRR